MSTSPKCQKVLTWRHVLMVFFFIIFFLSDGVVWEGDVQEACAKPPTPFHKKGHVRRKTKIPMQNRQVKLYQQDAILRQLSQSTTQKLKSDAALVSRVHDIARRINGYEQNQTSQAFFKQAAQARKKLARAIVRGHALHPAKVNPQWRNEAMAYLYVDKVGTQQHGKGANFYQLKRLIPYYKRLGIRTLYLLPFYPSVGDGGYAPKNQRKIRKDLGGYKGFMSFMKEANQNDMAVVIDFIPGHVADKSALVKRALKGEKQALDYLLHEEGEVQATPVPRNGEQWVKYRYRTGESSERLIEFPDVMKSNWSPHMIGGRKISLSSTFYPFQIDLNLQKAVVLKSHFHTLGTWLSRGVRGIRVDAVDHLVKLREKGARNLPESHAVTELFNLFVQTVQPAAIFVPEAVVGYDRAKAYFGKQSQINGKPTGSEANTLFDFELTNVLRHAMVTGDFSQYQTAMGRRRTATLPEGTKWILPDDVHDEKALGFIAESKRDAYRQIILKSGGAIFKNGWSGGVRLKNLLGKDPNRLLGLMKFSMAHRGTPAIYYGDELGKENSWNQAWKEAQVMYHQLCHAGKFSADEKELIKVAFSKQDTNTPPQDPLLIQFIDARHIHRGYITRHEMQRAMAGDNQVYKNLKRYLDVRRHSSALFKGGVEEPLRVVGKNLNEVRKDIGAFLRRYTNPKTKRIEDEVAVVANPHSKAQNVNLHLDDLTRKRFFGLVNLENGKPVPFERHVGFIRIHLDPNQVAWLRVVERQSVFHDRRAR